MNAEECSIVRLSRQVTPVVAGQVKSDSPVIIGSVTGGLAVLTPCSNLPD